MISDLKCVFEEAFSERAAELEHMKQSVLSIGKNLEEFAVSKNLKVKVEVLVNFRGSFRWILHVLGNASVILEEPVFFHLSRCSGDESIFIASGEGEEVPKDEEYDSCPVDSAPEVVARIFAKWLAEASFGIAN